MTLRLVSADSHVCEPPDLWDKYIEPRYRTRAPKVVKGPEVDTFAFEGFDGYPIGGMMSPYLRGSRAKRFHEGQRGAWDPDARMQEVKVDGIEAEVLYPSLTMFTYGMDDAGLQLACFRAYNDWLADYCSVHPDRLYGIALIPLYDVAAGVQELKRAVKKGLRGAAVWCDPPDECSFATDRYDPFWAEAQAAKIPVSLHVATGKMRRRAPDGLFLASGATSSMAIQQALGTIMASGVPERFPDLKLVSAEFGIGWVGFMMERMDYIYSRKSLSMGGLVARFKSGLLPSDHFKRNIRCTFMQDRAGIQTLPIIGADVPMWASDYPHDDSTWPKSQETVADLFRTVSDKERDKIVRQNATELYHISMI